MSSNRIPEDRLLDLMAKFKKGIAYDEEIKEIDRWYDSYVDAETYRDRISPGEWDVLGQRLLHQTRAHARSRPTRRIGTVIRLAAIPIAAAVLLFIGVRLLHTSKQPTERVAQEEITPGGNKATIRLADGRILDLSAEQEGVVVSAAGISYLDGTALVESTHMQIDHAVISTPAGGQYQLTLPDGTKVWLNSSTSLKYPVSFSGKSERAVELDGEAYFEVHRDEKLPFKVNTRKQTVEVLGTHFSINSYVDEPDVKTTLIAGSVRVKTILDNRDGEAVVLKPGEQSVIANDRLAVYDVDVQSAIDWTKGAFIFRNESLEHIMRRVARWYNVTVIYPQGVPENEYFKGRISRFDEVQTVLEMLAETGDIRFETHGRVISVLPSAE